MYTLPQQEADRIECRLQAGADSDLDSEDHGSEDDSDSEDEVDERRTTYRTRAGRSATRLIL